MTITEVSDGRANGVGFAEVDLGLGSTTEWIDTPRSVPDLDDGGRVDVVLTRLRAEATDRWRDDPEPVLRREVTLPAGTAGAPELRTEIRLDPRAPDAVLADWFDDPVVSSARAGRRTGSPRCGRLPDDDPATAWITPFGQPIGPSLVFRRQTGVMTRLAVHQPDGPFSTVTEVTLDDAAGSIVLDVSDGGGHDLERPVDLATARLTITGAELATTTDRRLRRRRRTAGGDRRDRHRHTALGDLRCGERALWRPMGGDRWAWPRRDVRRRGRRPAPRRSGPGHGLRRHPVGRRHAHRRGRAAARIPGRPRRRPLRGRPPSGRRAGTRLDGRARPRSSSRHDRGVPGGLLGDARSRVQHRVACLDRRGSGARRTDRWSTRTPTVGGSSRSTNRSRSACRGPSRRR